MSRAPLLAVLSWALVLASAAGSLPVTTQELHITPPLDTGAGRLRAGEATADPDTYRSAIEHLESREGAYSGALPEQLLSLGVSLQQGGYHQEAIEVLKRGVHLARINGGLYSQLQIPLLQREIASHIAMGEYSAADERQHYLYRVQVRSMESGLNRAEAFMSQAQWQYDAFRLGIGDGGHTRLMSMWDLYRLALNDIVEREGQTAPQLLQPLEGMLLSQYLIANFNTSNLGGVGHGNDNLAAQKNLNHFQTYKAESFNKGKAVIQAIYDIKQVHHGVNSVETARTKAMLGDWVFWHGEQQSALNAYREAIAELAARGDAKQEIEALFGEPVELPNYAGVSALPEGVATEEGNLQLEFRVNREGRVLDLERVDGNELNTARANHIMRSLRKTRFRPRLSLGEPQDTEAVTRAYEIQ